MLGWNPAQHDLVSEVAVEIDQTLGQPTTVAGAGGELFRQRRWTFSADALAAVATWFDKLAEFLKTQDVVAQSSTFFAFARGATARRKKRPPGRSGPRGAKDSELLRERLDGSCAPSALSAMSIERSEASARIHAGGLRFVVRRSASTPHAGPPRGNRVRLSFLDRAC